jgi:hypothetical protein
MKIVFFEFVCFPEFLNAKNEPQKTKILGKITNVAKKSSKLNKFWFL